MLLKSQYIYGFLIIYILAISPANADLHLVTTTNAVGAGSLDAAVAAANADVSGSVQIGFSLPANSTISLQNPLFLQKSMLVSTSTAIAAGASNLVITNPTGAVFLAGVRPSPAAPTVQIIIDGNNGSNGLTVTGTSTGGTGGGAGLGGALFVNQYTQVEAKETQFINSGAQGGAGSPVPVVTPATAGGHGGGGMLGAAGGVGGNTAGGGGGGGALGYDGGPGGSTAGAGGGGGGGALGVPNLGGDGGAGGNTAGGGGGGGGAGVGTPGTGGAGGSGAGAQAGGGGGGAAGAGALAGGGGAAGGTTPGLGGGAGGVDGGGGGGGGSGGAEGGGGFGGGTGDAGDTVPATPGGGGGGAGFGGAVFVRGNDSGGVAGVFTSTNSNVSTAWSDNTAVGGLGAGTAGNGTGDGEDLYLATGVTATFNVATGLTQNFSTATNTKSIAGAGSVVKAQLGTLIFSAQNTYSGGTTLTAGFLTLGDNASLGTGPLSMGGGILQSNATLTNITNIFTLTAPSSFGGSNSFTMSGTGGLAANALTVNNLAGTITLSGIISDGGLGGSIVKSGAGTLVLSAANSYTGGTVLSAGTLVAGNASALGTGTLNFNGGALQANAPLVLANPYSLTADSVINGSNDLTLSGPGTFGSFNLLVNNSAGTVTLSNSNNGTGSITLDGSILVLSGVNGYTGGTTVTAGTLRLGVSGALAATGAVAVNGGTLDVNGTTQTIGDLSGTVGNITMGGGSLTFGTSTASTTFGGVISQAATLIKQGSGAVLLSGNNSYSGTTRVNAGTLVVGHANALGTSNLELNGGNLQSNSALAITNNYSVTANSAINGSNSLALSGTGALGANILSVLNTAGTVTLSGVLSGVGGSIVQNGVGGTLLISGVGANTYTGGVTLTAGTLIAGKASALGTGALNLNGGTLQTNASLVLANPYSLTANSVINGSNDLTLSGPGTFGNFNLLVNNSAGTVTLSDSISGPGSITLNGNILVLSAVNSYTGGTTVTAGTLQLGVSGALAATGAVAVNGGTLDVNGTTQTISDLSGAAGTITMGGGSLTFGTAVSTTFGGVISETGNLIKQGSGTVILAGNNSFTGTTNINDGILLVNGTLAGPVIVNPGATLGGSGTIGNTVTNNGTVSPGSVLAILTIQGDYNVGANATTNIAINPQGQNARIAVQGTANIDGALTVNAAPGDYVIGTIYTFLTANTVAGTFSSVPTTIGNLKATVVYNAGSTSFELVVSTTNLEPSLSVGNANQRAVGTYIDTLAPVTGSDLAVTLGALAFLSPAQLAHALESISPGRLNASAVLLEDNAVFINKMNGYRLATLRGAANEELQFVEPTFNNRLQAYKPAMLQSKRAARQTSNFIKPSSFNSTKHGQLADTKQNFATQSFSSYDERSTIWVNPFGRYSNTSANDIDPRFNATTAGFAVGMDHKYANDFIVGISVGRYQSSINLIAFPDHMNVNTNFATLYGTWFRNGYYAEVSVVGGLPTYYSNHNIAYSGINRTSVGKHHGASIAPHLGIGKAFNFRTIMLTPYVSVDYIYISEQGYLLTGANSLDMDIQPKTANALYSEAGMKFSKTYVYADKLITPEVELSYTYVDAHNGNMAVSLLGQPGGFNVVNFSGSSYYVSPTIGILVKTISGGFVKAFFTSDFGSDYQAYEVSIRAGIAF